MNRPDDPLINRTDRLHAFTPQWAVPPDAAVADCAEEQGLPYDVLAHRLGLDEDAFRRLLEGRIPITETLAQRLADTLGSTPDFWMRLELNYQSDLRRLGLKRPGA